MTKDTIAMKTQQGAPSTTQDLLLLLNLLILRPS
jgi:hypothetical protein